MPAMAYVLPVSSAANPREMIKAVTIDFWGTLLLDSPAADERSRQQRLSGLYSVLDAMGIPVSREALDRAYGESGRRLERRWRVMRDVSVNKTVEGILRTVDARLPESLGEGAMAELVRVYATPPLIRVRKESVTSAR